MAEKKTAAKDYQKFKADLAAGTLGEVYIFCGEESYLREYYLKEVQKKIVPAGFEEFNFHRQGPDDGGADGDDRGDADDGRAHAHRRHGLRPL